jgi:putative copper resistance protein D
MNELSPWIAAIFLSKLLLYIALAMSVGGVSVGLIIQRYKSQQTAHAVYAILGALLGLVISSTDFFLQVGSFAETGLAGMMDKTYIQILWESGAGLSYQLRLIGWTSMLLLLIALRLCNSLTKPISVICLLCSLLVASSFTFIGHTTEQSLWVRFALVLHITIAMWWVGMLYPLRQWCSKLSPNTFQHLMHEFGKQASYLVATLLLTGLAISYMLEGSINALFNSLHGNVLLLKVVTVAAILALAARHKLRLVPSLTNKTAALTLQRSISIEMGIALVILVITATLSTLVGPAHI